MELHGLGYELDRSRSAGGAGAHGGADAHQPGHSAAILEAFGDKAVSYAVAYVALQVVRSAFMVVALRGQRRMGRNYAQLLAWSGITGVAWVAGAFPQGEARLIL
jgi:low temperature requirement protein LtrA